MAFDVMEVAPAYDHADCTVNVAHRLIMEILAGLAWKNRRAGSAGEATRRARPAGRSTSGASRECSTIVDQALCQQATAPWPSWSTMPSISGDRRRERGDPRHGDVDGSIGMDVDHWQVPLAECSSRPDFPGVEVERTEAWGVVGRLPGAGRRRARSLMLNGHVDVVPAGRSRGSGARRSVRRPWFATASCSAAARAT